MAQQGRCLSSAPQGGEAQSCDSGTHRMSLIRASLIRAPAPGINQSSALASVPLQPWTRGSSPFPHPKMLTGSPLCIEWVCAWWSFQGENSVCRWVGSTAREERHEAGATSSQVTHRHWPRASRPAQHPDSPKGRDLINILFSGGKLCSWQSKSVRTTSVGLGSVLNSVQCLEQVFQARAWRFYWRKPKNTLFQ